MQIVETATMQYRKRLFHKYMSRLIFNAQFPLARFDRFFGLCKFDHVPQQS
jgi:hypothetical protein